MAFAGRVGSAAVVHIAREFRTINTHDRLEVVRRIFRQKLEPIYGSQEAALQKIEEGKDRDTVLLYEGEMPVGLLVYKNGLSNEFADKKIINSLEIKTLMVIDAEKNSGRGYGSDLLKRALHAASKLGAANIHVTVSATKQESLEFFRKKKFEIIATFPNKYKAGVEEHLLCYQMP